MNAHECGFTDVHCVIHHIDEGYDETSYQWCMECGHVYQTEQELVDEYNRIIGEINANPVPILAPGETSRELIPPRTSADEIYFCQHCLHDF